MRWALVFAVAILGGAAVLAGSGEVLGALGGALISAGLVLVDALEQAHMRERTTREAAGNTSALRLVHDRLDELRLDVESTRQQVDRLNKANAFKGL